MSQLLIEGVEGVSRSRLAEAMRARRFSDMNIPDGDVSPRLQPVSPPWISRWFPRMVEPPVKGQPVQTVSRGLITRGDPNWKPKLVRNPWSANDGEQELELGDADSDAAALSALMNTSVPTNTVAPVAPKSGGGFLDFLNSTASFIEKAGGAVVNVKNAANKVNLQAKGGLFPNGTNPFMTGAYGPSFLDKEMIPGLKNKWALLGLGAVVAAVLLLKKKGAAVAFAPAMVSA